MWETWVRSLGQEDALEEEMTTHCSPLAWRVQWTEEPGGLQSMGLQRVRHSWATEHTHVLGKNLGGVLKCCRTSVVVYSLSLVLLCLTPWNIALQAPLFVHETSQARTLEWVSIFFSRGSSWPRDQTHVSCIGRRMLYHWATKEAQNFGSCGIWTHTSRETGA